MISSRWCSASFSRITSFRRFSFIKVLNATVERSLTQKRKLMLPGHRHVVVVGGGQSGCTIFGRLVNGGGYDPKESLIIDRQSMRVVKEGLVLLAYDMIDVEDVKRPILGQIHMHSNMMFEEVVHFDPDHNFIGTFDGSDVTFDYCVLCPSLQVDLSSVENLEFALSDKYTPVVSTYNIDSSMKMKEVLSVSKPTNIFVYCSGRRGLSFSTSVNHCLLLRSHFPSSNIDMMVHDESVCDNEGLNREIVSLLTKKNIRIHYNTRLVSIDNNTPATVHSEASGSRKIDFDLLYADPHYVEPTWLTNKGIFRDGFDLTSFQHKQYPSIFAQGSYILKDNTMPGMLEQSHACTINTILQMLCDNDVKMIDYNREAVHRDYQSHRIFVDRSIVMDIEVSEHDQMMKSHSPSKLSFYWFALNRYNRFFKMTAKGRDFGRLGYFMPTLSSNKSKVQYKKRKVSYVI